MREGLTAAHTSDRVSHAPNVGSSYHAVLTTSAVFQTESRFADTSPDLCAHTTRREPPDDHSTHLALHSFDNMGSRRSSTQLSTPTVPGAAASAAATAPLTSDPSLSDAAE